MPTYQFEAMDATGAEIKDVIEAPTEDEAQATIRQMGYFVTKISVKKGRKQAAAAQPGARKRPNELSTPVVVAIGAAIGVVVGGVVVAMVGNLMLGGVVGLMFPLLAPVAVGGVGGVSSKLKTAFTRQLSILQDAGLPILRSLKILEQQQKPGKMKYALMDVCDEIEAGSTLSEAMAKSPKVFDRLYVNMIKAGEAGGALEIILQRLADFMESAEALRRQVKGALIYPIMVVLVAVGILTFIMWKIVPAFEKIFADFDTELPMMTQLLVTVSNGVVNYWFLIPGLPLGIFVSIKLLCKFKQGKMGWDMFTLRIPIFGQIVEKNSLARTTRTLGTLISSGVPILEALNITRETAGNAVFERLYGKVAESIREGETIAKPMLEYSKAGFHPVALAIWIIVCAGPIIPLIFIPGFRGIIAPLIVAGVVVGSLVYLMKMNVRVVNDLVVNMVDVGEETGELDTMLYKVADTYDDEVRVLTSTLTKLMEPLLIIFLGGAVGFIVIALFLPLITLIQNLA